MGGVMKENLPAIIVAQFDEPAAESAFQVPMYNLSDFAPFAGYILKDRCQDPNNPAEWVRVALELDTLKVQARLIAQTGGRVVVIPPNENRRYFKFRVVLQFDSADELLLFTLAWPDLGLL